MRHAYRSTYLTAFQRTILELDLLHGTCKPHSPWQNGIIERSHKTDNQELFEQMRFSSSEERRYMLKLWEHEYNNRRPHQSLGGKTPMAVYLKDYRCHAATRMLT